MLLAGELFDSCYLELIDPDHVRWPESELADYLTGAIAQVASLKPTLFTVFVPIGLAPGVVQTVPAEFSELVDIIYNLNPDGTQGEPISQGSFTAARALGRSSCAQTYDGGYVVRSFTIHPDNDTYFYVDPPAPAVAGLGVWALVRRGPNVILARTDAVVMANTTPETYREALKDWMLYRAFAKDTESSDSFQRSQAHYKAFMQFVGTPPRDKDAVPVASSARGTASGAPSQ
jgi:hypothetical protein